MYFTIKSYKRYLPEVFKISAETLDKKENLEQGTTERTSGISSRYIFPPFVTQSLAMSRCIQEMCYRNKNALLNDIDLIINCSATTEQALPNTASAIIKHLQLNIAGIDVNLSCLSFVSALQMAVSLLNTGQYKNIVVVAGDMPHKCLNFNDPESSHIFGDGVVAYYLSLDDNPNAKLIGSKIKTYPEHREHCQIKMGGTLRTPLTNFCTEDFFFKMEGKAIFKAVAKEIDSFMKDFSDTHNYTNDDIQYLVPHQASHLGISHITNRLGFGKEKVINIYKQHGNQVAASLPIALSFCLDEKPKGKVLLVGTGAGLTIGTTLLEIL